MEQAAAVEVFHFLELASDGWWHLCQRAQAGPSARPAAPPTPQATARHPGSAVRRAASGGPPAGSTRGWTPETGYNQAAPSPLARTTPARQIAVTVDSGLMVHTTILADTNANDYLRYRREDLVRWHSNRLDAYGSYLNSVTDAIYWFDIIAEEGAGASPSRAQLPQSMAQCFDRAEAAADQAKQVRFSIALIATESVVHAADGLFSVLRETIDSMREWQTGELPNVASRIAALDTARNTFIEVARRDLHRSKVAGL